MIASNKLNWEKNKERRAEANVLIGVTPMKRLKEVSLITGEQSHSRGCGNANHAYQAYHANDGTSVSEQITDECWIRSEIRSHLNSNHRYIAILHNNCFEHSKTRCCAPDGSYHTRYCKYGYELVASSKQWSRRAVEPSSIRVNTSYRRLITFKSNRNNNNNNNVLTTISTTKANDRKDCGSEFQFSPHNRNYD